MSFCKSFQTLLGYSDVDDRRHFSLSPSPAGLSLIARTFHKPAYVLQSSALPKNTALLFHDQRGRGGGGGTDGADGFSTCTETLGFESSDDRIVVAGETPEGAGVVASGETAGEGRWGRRKSRLRWVKRETNKFPPPLPGLDQKGRSRSFLKAERKDGRFVLTEVQIERPEVFCARREGGRLRLQVVQSRRRVEEVEEENEVQHEEEEEEEEEEQQQQQQKQRVRGRDMGSEEGDKEAQRRYYQLQRCHHHHLSNHFSPIWNSRCVTTS